MQRAAKVRLTAAKIAEATCPLGQTQAFIWDASTPGLGLRVTPGGRKTFIYQSRLAGKSIRVTIGTAEVWAIGEARKQAAQLQTKIDAGRDPRIVKAERTAADQAQREKAEADKLSAIEVWPIYMEHCSTRQKRPWSKRTRLDHERLVDPGGKPKTRGRKKGEGPTTLPGALYHLLQLPLASIDADVIEAWLKQNRERPAVAEGGFVRLRAFMNWCARQKAYKGRINTEAFREDNVKEQVPELEARTDRLRRTELKAWFQAVRSLPNPVHAAYLQITLLTGCRRGELAPLRWDGVNFERNALRLDGKTGTREIPLSPYIRALLVALKGYNAANNVIRIDRKQSDAWKPSPHVFPSKTSKSGYIEEPRYSHEKAIAAAGLPHVSIHGLRRTFGSMSDSVGVDLPHGVVLQIQGHKPQGVAEMHYRVRDLEELAPWHTKYEAWILEQAGIEQPEQVNIEQAAPLRVVADGQTGYEFVY